MSFIKIIYGTEDYLMEAEQKSFLAACEKDFGSSLDVQTFTKDAVPANVVQAFEGTSLFGGSSVCIWHDSPYLPVKRGGRSRSKLSKDEEWFLQKVTHLGDQQAVLFITKGTLDTGCIFFKSLKPHAEVAKCEPVTDRNAMPHVSGYLKKKGKKLTVSAEHYLHGLFQTWESISLMYVFSELDKLCITMGDERTEVEVGDLDCLFSGTMEKNLFTFMDAFLRREGKNVVPLVTGLFAKQDQFLKNTGYMMSRLRLLRAYKELRAQHLSSSQIESILSQINKGRSVKYALYGLQKVESYWKIVELDDLINNIFKLQLNIRRGMGASADMVPLICLYCSAKGRHSK